MSTSIALRSATGRWVIAATGLGSGMIFLDSTVVNVALPRMQVEFAAPLSGLQWIINAYTLFLAAFLMLGGSIGDVYGRKTTFIGGLGVFTLASVACGLAPNLLVLIIARSLQGIGGALLVPGSLAMIKAVIAPGDSGRAIGLWAGLSGVTTTVGPLIGGYLVNAVSWRAIFFLNVPVAVLTLYATFRHVPPNKDDGASPHLDWIGAIATAVGLGGLTYALIQGPDAGWKDPVVVACVSFGVASVVFFPIWESRAAHPMVPLQTFRSRNFAGANLATLGVYFALSGASLFLVLNLQQVQGYSPLEAGLALLPITLLLLVLSPRMGALMARFGARLPMTVGPIVVGASFLLFMVPGRNIQYFRDFLPGIVLLGVGLSIFVTPLTATVMESVPNSLVGVASGVSNTLTRVASLLAISVLGLIVTAQFESQLKAHAGTLTIGAASRTALLRHANRLAADPIPIHLATYQRQSVRVTIDNAFISGFRWDMATCALLCLSSALISYLMIRDTHREQLPLDGKMSEVT
ncbi:MAG: MFS transporter [Chloroflexota bacterium]